MSENPSDLRYSNEHEWLRAEGDRWRVGITRFATQQLGDVVVVELPKVGAVVNRGDELGTIESVKAVSVYYAPISGKVVAVNEELIASPELLNEAPYDTGWIVELEPSDRAELDALMTADAYGALIASAE